MSMFALYRLELLAMVPSSFLIWVWKPNLLCLIDLTNCCCLLFAHSS